MYTVLTDTQIHAANPHKYQTNEWFAFNQLRRLERITVQGLPSVYKDKLSSYWYDFYPDFSWDGRADKQIELVLSSPNFDQLEAAFSARFNVSLRANLEQAVKDIRAGR